MAKVVKSEKKKTDREIFWDDFSKRLAETIDKKKISRAEFARRMNVTCVTVTHWLNDGRIPNGYYLNKICDVLKVSSDYLLGRKK